MQAYYMTRCAKRGYLKVPFHKGKNKLSFLCNSRDNNGALFSLRSSPISLYSLCIGENAVL